MRARLAPRPDSHVSKRDVIPHSRNTQQPGTIGQTWSAAELIADQVWPGNARQQLKDEAVPNPHVHLLIRLRDLQGLRHPSTSQALSHRPTGNLVVLGSLCRSCLVASTVRLRGLLTNDGPLNRRPSAGYAGLTLTSNIHACETNAAQTPQSSSSSSCRRTPPLSIRTILCGRPSTARYSPRSQRPRERAVASGTPLAVAPHPQSRL